MDHKRNRRDHRTRLSYRFFAANAVRPQLHTLVYNLGKRTLTGRAVVADQPPREADQDRRQGPHHGHYVAFRLAKIAISRQMLQEIVYGWSHDCARRRRSIRGAVIRNGGDDSGRVRLDERRAESFSSATSNRHLLPLTRRSRSNFVTRQTTMPIVTSITNRRLWESRECQMI
jgi:hypothetical protein